MNPPFTVAFELSLVHGHCVAVHLPEISGGEGGGPSRDALSTVCAEALERLAPEERAFAAALAGERRQIAWIGGRIAMRAALNRFAVSIGPILATHRGAPALPPGVVGSISHKETIAVALVAPATPATLVTPQCDTRIGVDVEYDRARRIDIAAKVLRDEELSELRTLCASAEERQLEVRLRFSAKEAVYKALDPFVERYVGFKEVAITPLPDGFARVSSFLAHGEGPFEIEVAWLRRDGLIVTSARIARRAPF